MHFRYYDKSEYSKLTKEQKTELREWRKGGAERGRSDAKTKKAKFEKAVAAAVEKKITHSYFPSSKLTAQTLEETEEVYLLTPSRWNPHCDSYAQNEENMLDWEGDMVERKDRM